MDKINNLLEKADKAAEKLVNKIEDEVDKSLDPPVVPMSTVNQVLVGVPAGIITGAVTGNSLKPTAIVVGTSIVGITLLNQMGYLDDFDNRQFSRDARNGRRQLDDELRNNNLPTTNQIRQFFKKNPTMTYTGLGAFIVSAAYCVAK